MCQINRLRKQEFKTLAKGLDNENNLKKGLFIFSKAEILHTRLDYLEYYLKLVFTKGDHHQTVNESNNIVMSQLDKIECKLLDNYENILNNILNNYDILFIGQQVNLSQEMVTVLNFLIEWKGIVVIFLCPKKTKLVYQLNYLQNKTNKVYNNNDNIQLNIDDLSQLTKHSPTLQNFYSKHRFTTLNKTVNYNNNGWTDVDLKKEEKHFNYIPPSNIIDRNDWHVLLKKNDNYSLLLHKKYKVLFSHWNGKGSFNSTLLQDLFNDLIKYLLFEYEIDGNVTIYKKNLLDKSRNYKLVDLTIITF
ncbi:hypothetical protein ABK040_016482 [Willaertia magna]